MFRRILVVVVICCVVLVAAPVSAAQVDTGAPMLSRAWGTFWEWLFSFTKDSTIPSTSDGLVAPGPGDSIDPHGFEPGTGGGGLSETTSSSAEGDGGSAVDPNG